MKDILNVEKQRALEAKRKVRNTLTWLILEVEDGHDVISEIKHRKQSHFSESLGKIAQIKNCQHFHVARLNPNQ